MDSPEPEAPAGGQIASRSTPPTMPRPGQLWALTLVASTLAAVGAWLAGEATINQFVPPERMVSVRGMMVNTPTFLDKASADRKNASLANGILGAALGLALGLAGGLSRRSSRSAIASGLAGTVLGLAAGVAASEAILPVYFQKLDKGAEELSRDLMLPLILHGGICAFLGAAAGASLGMGLGLKGRIASAALGGMIGGVLGAAAFEVVGALAFPADKTSDPIAGHWAPRLIAKLAVAILAAVFATFAVLSPAARKTPVGKA